MKHTVYLNSRRSPETIERMKHDQISWYPQNEFEFIETDVFSENLDCLHNSLATQQRLKELGRADLIRPL